MVGGLSERLREPAGLLRAGVLIAVGLVGMLLPPARHAGAHFLLAGLGWGAVVLAAFLGWGGVWASRVFKQGNVDFGQRLAWGMAVLVAAGGVLNLLGLVSRLTVVLLLALGAALAAPGLLAAVRNGWARRGHSVAVLRNDPVLAGVVAAVALLAALTLAASIHGTVNNVSEFRDFDLHDDAQAYLVFPAKMLQTGSIGNDPFDARRLITLGGHAFLQTLVLAVLPERSIHVLDAGIAMVVLVGVLLGFCRARRLEGRLTAAVLLLALLLPHVEARGNVTALATGTALLVALLYLLDAGLPEPGRLVPVGATVGLLAAALAALKLTFVPLVGLLLALSYLAALVRAGKRRPVLLEAALAAGLGASLLLPWMLLLWRSSGTLLYPVLGRGVAMTPDLARITALAGIDLTLPAPERINLLLRHLLHALPVACLALTARARSRRYAMAAFAVALLAAVPIVAMGSDPYLDRSIYRHYFPMLMAGCVIGLAASLDAGRRAAITAVRAGVAAGVALYFLLSVHDAVAAQLVQLGRSAWATVTAGDITSADRDAEAAAVQAVIPPGGTVLARMAFPSRLDLHRNRVLIDSLPGMASPKPGLPVFGGGEKLAAYLRGQGVRYLAYGGWERPERLLNLTEKDINDRYPRSQVRWAMLALHRDLDGAVHELAATRAVLLQARPDLVLDLAVRSVKPAAPPPGVVVTGAAGDGWVGPVLTFEHLGWRLEPGDACLGLVLRGWAPAEAEPSPVTVTADGRELPVASRSREAIVVNLPAGVTAVDRLEVRVAALDPARFGYDQAAGTLALDLREIRLGPDAVTVSGPPPRQLQEIAGPLRPEQVTVKAGFYGDNNWTGGDAVLDGLHWVVPAGHLTLVVEVGAAHPFGKDAARLGVKVAVNGMPLLPAGSDGRRLLFALPRGVTAIERIRVTSTTFVPKAFGLGNDTRTLGLPIVSITTR